MAMKRYVGTAILVTLLCVPWLAASSAPAWARHCRVVADPCPDRCKSTRLSLCSACMGGIMTCAQHLVCSNNRAVVCGDGEYRFGAMLELACSMVNARHFE
jgi:hypothetical protein